MEWPHRRRGPTVGTVDGQQPKARLILKAVAVVVLILVVSALLDLLLQHQTRP